MKLKIIESVLLIAIVLFVAGCEGFDCFTLNLDQFLLELFGDTYVQCSGGSHPYPVLTQSIYRPALAFKIEPGQTAGDFDCSTSTNFGTPLPHVRTAAAIPPGPGAAPDARSRLDARTGGYAASQAYARYGFNNGYVPPPIVNPVIPVPVISPSSAPSTFCSPNQPDVLFVNHLHNSVSRFATCPFSSKAVISVASRPLQVAVTPDGRTAVVTSFDNAVNFVDLANNTVSYTLTTDSTINPGGVAIAPDGKLAYVSSFNGTNSPILVIDIASHTILTKFNAQPWPMGLYVTPDGSQLWVTYPFQNGIDTFDLLTNTEIAVRSVNAPSGIAFNSTGTRAYVTSGMGPGGALVVFDAATLKQMASYTVGTYPLDARVAPGDRFVVVDNFGSGNLSLLDTVTGTVFTGPASNGNTLMGLVPVQ